MSLDLYSKYQFLKCFEPTETGTTNSNEDYSNSINYLGRKTLVFLEGEDGMNNQDNILDTTTYQCKALNK